MTTASLLVLIGAVALAVGLVPRINAYTPADFREGLVTPERPLSLDPLIGADTSAVHDVGHLLYRGLMRLDGDAFPKPDLASSYSVDQSGTTYTVALSPGQRWSSGVPITAADVVATVQFAQAHATHERTLDAAISGVRAGTDGSNVVFTLAAPRASFVAALAQLPILPLGGLQARELSILARQATTPLPTSGPYRVQSADASAVELVANAHASSKPHLNRFELRLYASFDDAATAFTRGDVDGVLATTPAERARLASAPHARAHDIATFRFVDLVFNERVVGLDDPAVREAVAAAVDRRLLIAGALAGAGGLMQTDAVSRGLPWIATHDPREQASVAVADSTLQADGWVLGTGGVRVRGDVTLSYTLEVPDSQPLPQVATELAQQLQGMGMWLTVDVVPASSFVSSDVDGHAFQLALADWNAGPDPDVSAFWRSTATPPSGFNVSGGQPDPFLDQALDMLATLGTRAERQSAAASVSSHLAADLPALFLYTPTVSFVTRGAVSNVVVPAVGDAEARYDAVASWRRG